jgi:hypothetical protein
MRFEDLEIGKLYVENTHDYNDGWVMECVEICKDEANFKVIKGNAYFKENQPLRFGCIYIGTDSFQPLIQTHEEVERVNHPSHYNQGIEAIEYIESHKMDFNEGNVIKYLTRAKYKGTYLEDLKKARWYLDRLIQKGENND